MGILQIRLPEPIYLSTELRNYLGKIKDNELVEKLQSKVVRPPINYLDVKVKNKEVLLSFLDSKRQTKLTAYDNKFNNKLRQESRIGKVVRKLFPTIHDDTIRPFVENLQSLVQAEEIKCFIVQGDDIRKVYKWPRKYCLPGSLQSSCFQGIVLDENFELFRRNPDKIKCGVAMQNGFLAARQLIYYGELKGKAVWSSSDLNGTSKATNALDRFVKEYQHGCPPNNNYYDFIVKDLVNGTPLHHFGMNYISKGDTAELKPGSYSAGMANKWYNNPDSPNNQSYSTFIKPKGVVVIPEDLTSEGLEKFWP